MFLVFTFNEYTTWSWDDSFRKSFDTVEEAVLFVEQDIVIKNGSWDTVEIVNLETCKKIRTGHLNDIFRSDFSWDRF